MICPKCKKEIPDNSVKCPYCKTRTGLICKKCNTVNSILSKKCKNCGNEILKICPNCSSANMPEAKKCRKCSYSFKPDKSEIEEQDLKYPPNSISQENAKNILIKGLLSDNKKIFSLTGQKGIGKTLVLKTAMKELADLHFSWIYGKCTPITQLTSGGLIQDMLLNLFNLPNICVNNMQFKKEASKFFKSEFPELTNNEIFDLMNFLYPTTEGNFEDLTENKHKTYNFLYKIFEKIESNNKFILAADNFEYIDGFSYDFLNHLIRRPQIKANLKFILLYNKIKPSKGYFYLEDENENIYLDMTIAPTEYNYMQNFIQEKEKNIEGFPFVSEDEKKHIYTSGKGNPLYINQALCLKFDSQIADKDFKPANTVKKLIEQRLLILSEINPAAFEILTASAILGDKININLIKEIYNLDDNKFNDIILYLNKMDYIIPMNEIYFEFSSLLIWETLLNIGKDEKKFIEINKKILSSLSNITLSSFTLLAVIAQNLKQTEFAFDIWTKNTRLGAFIGDTNLYAIAQKQCLALINELDEHQTLKTRYNISERLGKLLSSSNPSEAMEYLPDGIANAQAVGDTPKEIELLSYLSYCCRKTGNYYGEVECVDAAIKKIHTNDENDNNINSVNELETALLKCSKLGALLNIGNCGQVINMIDNEIMPVLDNFLIKNKNTKHISLGFVFETCLKTYLMLANALVIQGNDRCFEILTILFDIIERNNIQDELFICKCKLALAFANTIKGDFKASDNMLEEILRLYKTSVMDNEAILRWNFINTVNNFMRKQYNNIQEDLFQIVTFADNNGDNFTKNTLKTLLGKVFKDYEQTARAMDIYNEQITYFAKEKMALGALLTWYLIADATLITEGPQNASEIAQQALDVALNPKIDNYYFAILLRTIIIKANITISDFESAKIQLKTAIADAERFGLKDLLSRLYLLYGKYYQELGLNKSEHQNDYVNASSKMYQKAKEYTSFTNNNHVIKKIENCENALKAFCNMNSLELNQ